MANFFGPRAVGRAASRFKRRYLYGINKPRPRAARAQPARARGVYGSRRTQRTQRTQGYNPWAIRAGKKLAQQRSGVYGAPVKTQDMGDEALFGPLEQPLMLGGNLEAQRAYGTPPQTIQRGLPRERMGAHGMPQQAFTGAYGDPQAGKPLQPAPGADVRLPGGQSAQDTFFSLIQEFTRRYPWLSPDQIAQYAQAQIQQMLGR